MSEDRYKDWLGDYVDGTLSDPDRRLLETHLAVCESCQSTADDLLRIKKAARSLPRLTPPRNGWKQIEAALRAEQPETSRTTFWFWSTRWAIAATAVLVIGSLGLLVWWNSPSTPPPAEDRAELASYVASELEQAEKHYGNAITGLEQIIVKEEEEQTLDPAVMAVLNDNLDLIEQAIGESRDAAVNDPENDVARDSFLGALRSKVSLLQNTILLINEVRKGRGQNAYDLLNEMREVKEPSDPI
jgi:hypothetical protein